MRSREINDIQDRRTSPIHLFLQVLLMFIYIISPIYLNIYTVIWKIPRIYLTKSNKFSSSQFNPWSPEDQARVQLREHRRYVSCVLLHVTAPSTGNYSQHLRSNSVNVTHITLRTRISSWIRKKKIGSLRYYNQATIGLIVCAVSSGHLQAKIL